MINRRDFIKLVAITLAATTLPLDVDAAKSCQARTRYGTYNGFIDKRGVQTWLGIPYAKPPVDDLRWHAPQPLEPSDHVEDAKTFGSSPIQDKDETEDASLLKQSEDCLTLNIWTRDTSNKLPVMVFIPGGGFVNGGSADLLYNGAKLAANNDVVVVTINYRLNVFGFMNFAAIDSAFDDTGYLGIKDQVAALTWIKENIANFGGDPDNVTIFGESAGSISAMLLMVTPAARGLFNKVIAQSGHISMYHTPEQSAKLAQEFMELGGYKDMQELMTTPPEKILSTYEQLIEARPFATEVDYFPTCDGKYLPLHPLRALKDGSARGVKIMTGNTADEYRYWNLYDEHYTDHMKLFHAEVMPLVYESKFPDAYEIYQAWQKNHAGDYLEFANQFDWRVGQELVAEYQSAFDDVYFYLFSQQSPNKLLGSCHAIDLPFVFGNASDDIEPNPSKRLIKEVQGAWVSFATTGQPRADWAKYTADNRQTMEINAKAWTCHHDLNVDNLNDLRGVYENNLLD